MMLKKKSAKPMWDKMKIDQVKMILLCAKKRPVPRFATGEDMDMNRSWTGVRRKLKAQVRARRQIFQIRPFFFSFFLFLIKRDYE